MDSPKIQDRFDGLPESAKKQVLELIDSLTLAAAERTNRNGGFSFSWEGGLAELKAKYTSVDLQHKINDFR